MSLCYFCQSECFPHLSNEQSWFCQSCTSQNDLKGVYTTGPSPTFLDADPPIIHIYVVIGSHEYHIRYYTDTDRTTVLGAQTDDVIFTVNGFHFTPTNVKKKLAPLIPFA
jgi:hypothetical protein